MYFVDEHCFDFAVVLCDCADEYDPLQWIMLYNELCRELHMAIYLLNKIPYSSAE